VRFKLHRLNSYRMQCIALTFNILMEVYMLVAHW
jgi:hypothetical protein